MHVSAAGHRAGKERKGNQPDQHFHRPNCIRAGRRSGRLELKHDVTLNGALGDARKATAEIGEAMTNEVLDYLERLVDKIIAYQPTPEKLFK